MPSEVEILSDYIRTELGYNGELTPELDLFGKKVLDSFSIVQIAVFIQDRFHLELDADDLVGENFSTLSRIVALIAKRTS